ncbi:hypothetical protein Rhopal_004795-T1 [Rhodotorula paludigena]|uniref:Uncharacterized protein n=1 Tax=Rhodotorula paludigena TaxID=86838 RepID=A0AAV5GQL1_9BASI|nr:hypothetical protein Rhopal_004795-T1 [Rhodotorula paludigena]
MARTKQILRKLTSGKAPRRQLRAMNARKSVSSGTMAGKATTSTAQREPQVITDDLLAEALAFAEAALAPPPKQEKATDAAPVPLLEKPEDATK